MKVVIIGSGNVATIIGDRIVRAGHSVLQVARSRERAEKLAAELGCGYTTQWENTNREAELYIAALSDRALEGLGKELSLPGKLVVHTAGAVAGSILSEVSANYGVLYPLQSLRSGIRPFPEFPLLVTAGQPADLTVIEAFARTIARQVARVDDATRLKLHVAAILVNNFTNYLYTLAADFCRQEGIDFSLLLPLIRETAERIERFPPRDVQTGPAVRGDKETIEKHLQVLDKYDNFKEIYRLFTIQIEQYYRAKEIHAGE
jgi:predicted short-subunit dehydrogenase-like oxidoreductase (DUF2520 family)